MQIIKFEVIKPRYSKVYRDKIATRSWEVMSGKYDYEIYNGCKDLVPKTLFFSIRKYFYVVKFWISYKLPFEVTYKGKNIL